MEKLIIEFLNIYFWIFIIAFLFRSIDLIANYKKFKISMNNTIKTGLYHKTSFVNLIAWVLFILSIKYL